MEVPSSPSLQPLRSTDFVSAQYPINTELKSPITVNSTFEQSNSTVENHCLLSEPVNNGNKVVQRKKKKNKSVCEDVSAIPSFSSCSSSLSTQKGVRLASKRRVPKVQLRRSGDDVDSIALPLGMSFAAVVAQVLERKDAAGGRISIDHLSLICASAVRESLANVYGDKFDCFVGNFEKSFGSTLRTLRLINEASSEKEGYHSIHQMPESSTSDMNLNKSRGCTENNLNANEDVQENISTGPLNRELTLHGQMDQLACVSTSSLGSVINHVGSFERSVMEQTRSNDLKTLELGLTMKKLRLKETQLALNVDSNHLERSKLAMGISKASFKAEKFKNQLEETRHAELLKKCIDCLVAGLFVMSASLIYGAYVYSYERIIEATASCSPQESKSWWIPKPISSLNTGFNILWCQVQVVSRMLFGVLIILAIAYLLLQRSASTKDSPVTFILLLLGTACGFVGKLCVDTLGGSGYHWLIYWESLCVLHFFSNVYTSVTFSLLHGPVNMSRGVKGAVIPYWARRVLYYAVVLLFLPLFCGLMPFATLGEWKDHFLLLATDYTSSN